MKLSGERFLELQNQPLTSNDSKNKHRTVMTKPYPLNSKTPVLMLVLCSARLAFADFYPIPLTPGSFNKDIIVERTASPPMQTLVTANMDAGTNTAGIAAGGGNGGNQGAFCELGATTTAGTGVPYHGTVFTAVSNAAGT